MLKDYTDSLKYIHSKIGSKIVIFVCIQITFIVSSFTILSYYQSQMTYLGNSINIAVTNLFITSNLMLHTSEYLLEGREASNKEVSRIKMTINQLESNMVVLKQGGKVGGIDLKPLPVEFLNEWNEIYQKWVSVKKIITNNLVKLNETSNSQKAIDNFRDIMPEAELWSLIDLSNILVTKLSEYVKSNSEYSLFTQRIFIVLDISVIATFMLYLARKILKPIFALSIATSKVRKVNLNITAIKTQRHDEDDELSVITESFNIMMNSLKTYVREQNKLTELEKTNEELIYKDQLKDEFLYIALHEMIHPTQSILAFSELLRRRSINIDEKNKEFLDGIIKNSKRLKNLAEGVLDIARIESNSLILNKEKFSIKEMITEIVKDYEHIIRNKKNIKLSYEFRDNSSTIINADKNRIIQVISNLLNNAIKFTEKGIITVIVERKENEILVSIKDTGIGINPEILPKLFTKFTMEPSIGGTGLGLFISKSIIERHDGKIWAINNNEIDREKGVGSTFTFSLPLK
jgi:signal transduction histidine kinase